MGCSDMNGFVSFGGFWSGLAQPDYADLTVRQLVPHGGKMIYVFSVSLFSS